MEHGISHSSDYSVPSAALTDDHRREGFQQRGCRLSQGAEWGPKGLNYGAGRDVLLEGLLAFPGIWRLSTSLLPDRITASLQPLLPAPTSSSPTYITMSPLQRGHPLRTTLERPARQCEHCGVVKSNKRSQ